MKKILLVLIAFLVTGIASAQIKRAELQAAGLTCAMCSNAINKALKKVPFIETVETDLNKNIFSITFKKGSTVDIDELQKKVKEAGFSVGNLWLVISFDNDSVKNDTHIATAGSNFHFLDIKQQVLSGDQKIRIVDKNFVSAKEYKKFCSKTTMECIKTGYMSSCCKSKAEKGTRIYHVTI